jgi:hypothetical protein
LTEDFKMASSPKPGLESSSLLRSSQQSREDFCGALDEMEVFVGNAEVRNAHADPIDHLTVESPPL